MGRVEQPVDPNCGPLHRFAHELQVLRRAAGEPTYRAMGRRAGISPSVLSEAAKGRRLPTLHATLAFVRACDGTETQWRDRWEQTRAELNRPTEPAPAMPSRRRYPLTRWRWQLLGAVALVGVTVLVMSATGLGPIAPRAADQRPTVRVVADGDDPYVSGCGSDQQPLERQPIYWADGRSYGWIVLFYSAACAGAWGYVLGPNSPNWRVNISAHRLDDDIEASSSFQGEARPNSWGNALSTRTGCVRAEAWVDNGPRALTSCWRPRGPATSAAVASSSVRATAGTPQSR